MHGGRIGLLHLRRIGVMGEVQISDPRGVR